MRWWPIYLIVILALNLAGFGLLYYKLELISRQFPPSGLEATLKNGVEIQAQLTRLQNQLVQSLPVAILPSVLRVADLLPDRSTAPASPSGTFITISADWTAPVNVYKEQAQYSAVLGQLVPDYQYPYYTKLDGWYLVGLLDGQTGWVNSIGVFENP